MEDFKAVVEDAYIFAACGLGLLLVINIYFLFLRKAARRENWALRIFRSIAVVIFAAGLYFALFQLLPLSPIVSAVAKAFVLLMLALWVFSEILRMLMAAMPEGRIAIAARSVVSVGLLVVGLFFLRDIPSIRAEPAGASEIALRPPFEGEWIAVHAGPAIAANHHVRIPEQNYAADLTKVGPNGDIRRGVSDDQTDFWSFGSPVLSPVDGIVAKAVDGRPDGEIPKEWDEIAGNHVAIEFAPGKYVLLAHFQKGSVAVEEGDIVSVGDLIARSGNSGNSDLPHLHIHVQDKPGVEKGATAFPWSINGKSITRNDVIVGR